MDDPAVGASAPREVWGQERRSDPEKPSRLLSMKLGYSGRTWCQGNGRAHDAGNRIQSHRWADLTLGELSLV